MKDTFLQAMARMEGFYAPKTRAFRNNNPGNIEYGRFARAHGALKGDPRFAVFPDAAAGFACMAALFKSAYVGLNVAAAVGKWAPPNENNTQLYVKCVCEWTGLTPDTIITDWTAPKDGPV